MQSKKLFKGNLIGVKNIVAFKKVWPDWTLYILPGWTYPILLIEIASFILIKLKILIATPTGRYMADVMGFKFTFCYC